MSKKADLKKDVKKDKIPIPDYTKGEEIFNMVTHIVGGTMGIAVAVLCIVFAAKKGNPYSVVSAAIFGSMMIVIGRCCGCALLQSRISRSASAKS